MFRPKRPPAIERESYLKFSRRKSTSQLAVSVGNEVKSSSNLTNPPNVLNPPTFSPSPSVHSLKYSSCENIEKESQLNFKYTGKKICFTLKQYLSYINQYRIKYLEHYINLFFILFVK